MLKKFKSVPISILTVLILTALILIPDSWSASREPVRGASGMVVSSHQLASEVGVEILKQGGNAVDAAVAVGYALAVVFPTAGNLGGGGFMVIRFPDSQATTIDFREVAPQQAHRDMYLDENGNIIPNLSTTGYLASGVPGSVAGLNFALEKYGRLPLKKILAPALRLAKKGFPVDYKFHQDLVRLAGEFRKYPASAKKFLKNGKPYQVGELFVQKDLARTLTIISKQGSAGFYAGPIAELIEKDMQKHQGLITKADLANYRPQERPPLRGTYRDYELISMGPPSSGGIAIIQFLNILESFNLEQIGFNSSLYLHLVTEALRRVFADRATHLGDPDFWEVPVSGLISKTYATGLREKINFFSATLSQQVTAGEPFHGEGHETTHYSVVDQNKMCVAVTTTLNSGYGSLVVIEKAGFLMNNEMDDFSIKPAAPNLYGLIGNEANAIAPGKRMLSSMSPTIVVKNNLPFLVLGAMGGPAIITSVAQTILNVIDFKMTIQEAIDAPKIHHQWLPDMIFYEKFGIPKDVLENLARKGHHLAVRRKMHSETNAIMICPRSGTLLGGADSRLSAVAVGY